ncbi:hypothetical protein TorRG33x02_326510 [Trema orientale]|uniref:Uncharacterized protein n=1 Tax=Trema orientale TaxID=63057 RepID=A0A2P5BBY0_TREOI|nr:hypothetical protein TorRG33x02_326510 [Trema orientale]
MVGSEGFTLVAVSWGVWSCLRIEAISRVPRRVWFPLWLAATPRVPRGVVYPRACGYTLSPWE